VSDKSCNLSKIDAAGMSASRLAGIRCFLFDMDGTICLGEQLLPGAGELLAHLDAHDIPFYFITNNSSRSRREYAQKLNRLGLPYGEERIFTSGEATAIYLRRQRPNARLYVVGTLSLEEELAAEGFKLVQESPDAIVLGFDTTLTYEKLWKLCDLVRTGVPYIATHPDINCPTEMGFMPDIGAIIAFVEASTGRKPDLVIGKPNRPMVEAIMEKTGIPAEAMAMVGDRLYTDIAMGQAGLITVLVLSGETHWEDVQASGHKPDFIFRDLADFLQTYQTI
jgi:HAD superfamily hydrolase (TIGR01457 family)